MALHYVYLAVGSGLMRDLGGSLKPSIRYLVIIPGFYSTHCQSMHYFAKGLLHIISTYTMWGERKWGFEGSYGRRGVACLISGLEQCKE